jgi:nucleotide-binding universal stress UspA family protein
MFKNILICVDGSDSSLRAAEVGCEIAASMGNAVTVVYAAYIPAMYMDDLNAELQESIREDGKRILDETVHACEAKTGGIEKKLLYNEKAEEGILRLLEEGTYDLVILGSNGRDATARKVMGSTSSRVLEGSAVPVLIVP